MAQLFAHVLYDFQTGINIMIRIFNIIHYALIDEIFDIQFKKKELFQFQYHYNTM